MDLAQFEHDLDRHGADLSRWPAPTQAAAARFMAETPAARTLFDAMRGVEDVLRRDATAAWPPPDAQRFAAFAVRHRQTRPSVVRTAWAAAAVAAVAFGLVLGDLLPDRHADPANLVSAAFATPELVDVD